MRAAKPLRREEEEKEAGALSGVVPTRCRQHKRRRGKARSRQCIVARARGGSGRNPAARVTVRCKANRSRQRGGEQL